MYRRKQSTTKEPDSAEHAYNYAVFLLGLRLRTEGEIRSKMKLRGYTDSAITTTVERLKDNKYVDDAQFAAVLLENFKLYKTYGYFLVKKKMREKLLPKDIIEQHMAEHFLLEDEIAIARRYLKKEGWEGGELDFRERQKLSARLAGRGFRLDAIQGAFSGEDA